MGDLEAVFAALAHERRRVALSYLQEHHTVTLPDLAELVAEREYGTEVQQLPAEQVKDIYMSLYHRHVPALEEGGLVRYEQEGDLVRRTEAATEALGRAREELERLGATETA